MDSSVLQIVMALLPFAVLFVGFMVFKADALKLSLVVWVLEVAVCGFLYQMDIVRIVESSLWGNITLWTGFLVLWTGQVFGSCYRSTGLLNILLSTLGKIMPTKEGKSLTLVTVVAGYLGAFNGFATYPVTIPGLKNLGFSGLRAAAAYLVYFAWNIAFVSLFVAANIAAGVSKIAITEIIQVMGLISIPLCVVSTIGFFVILQLDLKRKDNIAIAALTMVANILAVVIFTQVLPDLYLLTLIASATFCLIAIKLYSKTYDKSAWDEEEGEAHGTKEVIKAFGPLVCCMVLVILMSYPLEGFVEATTISLSLWGYTPTSISLANAPGTFVLITAILCYPFAAKKSSTLAKDVAGRVQARSAFAAHAAVRRRHGAAHDGHEPDLASGHEHGQPGWRGVHGFDGRSVVFVRHGVWAGYAGRAHALEHADVGGACARHRAGGAHRLATIVCMGSANPIKPSLLKYASSLADVKGQDGQLFNLCLPWQLGALIVCVVMGVVMVALGYVPVPLL